MTRLFLQKGCFLLAFVALSWLSYGATLQMNTVKVGEAEVTSIQVDSFFYSAEEFSNAPEDAKRLQCYPLGQARAGLNCFVIHYKDRYILVDSGNGNRDNTLVSALERLHIKPSQISDILLTHLHEDHFGGIVSVTGVRMFPNATLWIAIPEYSSALRENTQRKQPADFEKVQSAYSKKIKFFKDGATLLPGIRARVTAGHTPGHSFFILEDKMIFIGSAVMAHQWQLNEPDLYRKDSEADPKKSAEVRRMLLQEAADKPVVIAGAHLPFPGMGTIHRNEKGKFIFKYAK